jgi:hypothetical protein
MQSRRGVGGGWEVGGGLGMGRVLLGRARSLMRGLVIFLIATPACGFAYTGERFRSESVRRCDVSGWRSESEVCGVRGREELGARRG